MNISPLSFICSVKFKNQNCAGHKTVRINPSVCLGLLGAASGCAVLLGVAFGLMRSFVMMF